MNGPVVEARYSIARFVGRDEVHSMSNLANREVTGILQIVLGDVPDEIANGLGKREQEWKIHIGGPHWIVVRRDQ